MDYRTMDRNIYHKEFRVKIMLLMLFVFIITGCSTVRTYSTNVPSEEEIAESITYNFNEIKKGGHLRTEAYLSEGFSSVRRITYFYRAKHDSDKVDIQLYARMGGSKWCLIEQVYDEFDEKINITLIEKKSISRNFVSEDFALNLSMKDLEKLSQQDISFKALGISCTMAFTIDKRVSNAFINRLYKHI